MGIWESQLVCVVFLRSTKAVFSGKEKILQGAANLKSLPGFPALTEIVCISEEMVYTLRAMQVLRKLAES